MLRGWQLSGITAVYSGPLFTPRVANFNFLNGEASRPDRTGKGTLEAPSVEQWFDRTQFPVVPVGGFRFGTSGRDILDGPGTFNVNSSLSRRFKIAESWAAQCRFEAFNVMNHANFNLPENRVLQFGMRLEF